MNSLGKIGLSWVVLAGVLVLGGCVTSTGSVEIPFGTKSEVGPLGISTSKTDEGQIFLSITSTATETLKTDIRMRRATIGRDYGKTPSNIDPEYYSVFDIEDARRTLSNTDVNEFTIQMRYLYQVSRPFYTIIYANISGAQEKWKLQIRVEDEKLFTDVEYLRQINKTDYWHPRIIEENWNKYLSHIGR